MFKPASLSNFENWVYWRQIEGMSWLLIVFVCLQRGLEYDTFQWKPRLWGPEWLELSRGLSGSNGPVWLDPRPLHLIAAGASHDAWEVLTWSLWHVSADSMRSLSRFTNRSVRRTFYIAREDILSKVPRSVCTTVETLGHRRGLLRHQLRQHPV